MIYYKIDPTSREKYPTNDVEKLIIIYSICLVVALLFLFWQGVARAEERYNADEMTQDYFHGVTVTVDTAIIAKMESSDKQHPNGNPFAINGTHRGICQISEGVLHDYNKAKGTIWEPYDLFNVVINLRIGFWYINQEIPRLLRHYGLPDTLENRLTAWRLGIKSILSNKQAKKYVKRYNELIKEVSI